MRIVVLEGRPNKKGSSNLLTDEFIRGAKEAGHTVEVIDAAHANLCLPLLSPSTIWQYFNQ